MTRTVLKRVALIWVLCGTLLWTPYAYDGYKCFRSHLNRAICIKFTLATLPLMIILWPYWAYKHLTHNPLPVKPLI